MNDSAKNFESLREKIVDSYREKMKFLLESYQYRDKTAEQFKKKDQVILVIGAGFSIWSNISTWGSLNKEIIDCIFEEFREELLLEEFNFKLGKSILIEEIISHFSQIKSVQKKIKNKVTEIIKKGKSNGNKIQLGYELVAHLFKHDFIDHIINFNFDGILDETLEFEIGIEPQVESDYHYFYKINDSIERRKHVINIHGHIKNPSTLKVGMDEVQRLDHYTTTLLDDIIGTNNNVQNSILLSVGYSWNDPDLKSYMETSTGVSDIFNYNKEPNRENIQKPFFPIYSTEISPDAIFNENGQRLNGLDIDEFVWILSKEILEITKSEYYVSGISRHEILGKVFGPNLSYSKSSYDKVVYNSNFSAQKIFNTEFIIHWYCAKGLVSIENLAKNKRFYEYFKHLDSYNLGRFTDCLASDFKSLQNGKTDDFKNNSIVFFNTGFQNNQFKPIEEGLSRTLELANHKKVREPKYENGKILITRDLTFEEFVLDRLELLKSVGKDINLVPGLDPRTDFLFQSPIPISNWSVFSNLSGSLLNHETQNIFIISENGRWIGEHLNRIKPGICENIYIICSKYSYIPFDDNLDNNEKDQYDKIKNKEFDEDILSKYQIKVHRLYMYWYAHNHHMSFSQDQNGKISNGIYYLRRSKGHNISPVWLNSSSDLNYIKGLFMHYVERTIREYRFNDQLNKPKSCNRSEKK